MEELQTVAGALAVPFILCAISAYGMTQVTKKLLIDLFMDRTGAKTKPWFYDSVVGAAALIFGAGTGAVLELSAQSVLTGLAGGALSGLVAQVLKKKIRGPR